MAAPFPSPTSKWHDNTYESLSYTRPELSAKGKTVVVTGGGSGIGAETARHFAAAGASRIALLGRREQPLLDTKASIEKAYGSVEVFIASTDITKKEQVDVSFAEFIGNSNGKINVLISNAAMIGPQEPVGEVEADEFLSAIYQNLQGSLYVAQAFLRYAAPDAVVVDVNSSAAHLNFAPVFASYSVAKLAIFRMWNSFGCGNPGLSIFHIQPGVVNTDMNKEAGGVAAMGFEDHVSLPAGFGLWLASPEARFLKGKYLWANWDVEELKAKAKEIEGSTQFDIGLVGWPWHASDWTLDVPGGGFK